MQNRNPALGFSLAILACITWGTLPIAAHQVLAAVNAQTLVWARFVSAAVMLFVLLSARHKLPELRRLPCRMWLWLAVGCVGLSLNFFLFSESLNYISPTTTQVLWQLAPFTMILCSVAFFGERWGAFQKIGSLLLLTGLMLFFNQNFNEILQFGQYALGIALAAAAAVIWVLYGLAQKILLARFSSQQILLLVYAGCGLLLTPAASPVQLFDLSGFALVCFVYCCLNTLIGYGAYGESLNHWDASKISVITTMLPIFTMVFALLLHRSFPDTFAALDMNALSYLGAVIVVAGAILAAAGEALFAAKQPAKPHKL